MKQTNAITDDFFRGICKRIPAMDVGAMSISYKDMSNMMTEALVVLDFHQKNFLYMSNHDLSLCGYTQEKPQELGYDFFKDAIHPKDLPFWINVHNTILESLNNYELPTDNVNYFSFLLRVKSSFTSHKRSHYIMIYVKLKPKWFNEQLRYGICLLSASVVQKPDKRLRVHYYNYDHSEYSFRTHKWTHHPFSPLSNRHREMLTWSQQGLTITETADKMGLSDNTVKNMRHQLFEKFGINSVEQAIQYASNRLLIYHSPPVLYETVGKKKNLLKYRPKRNILHSCALRNIQDDLDQGKTVNAIAKTRKIPESTIRYNIKKGKLMKNS